jgi:hypothetical protein
LEVEDLAVVEEPELGQDERSCEQGRRNDPGRRRNERDERDEPDGVLRGEEACKNQEAGNGRSRRGHESLRARAATGEEPRDEEDGSDLSDPRRHGDRVRQRADQIAGERERRAADDLGVVHAEPVRGEQQRAAETLDLERALGLCLSALPEPVPAHERKRPDNRDDDTDERQ